MKNMNLKAAIEPINVLLSQKCPETFNSSWILKHAPSCYRYIQKHIRSKTGAIDWDRETQALQKKHQRRWVPKRKLIKSSPYWNQDEVNNVLKSYQEKLHVFIVFGNQDDRYIWITIGIRLVRLAQRGNLSAKHEIMKFVGYTVDEWIEQSSCLYRWKRYDVEVKKLIEGCILRYRYTGSFLNYVYRTLEYAARGVQPSYVYSLDKPLGLHSSKLKIENVIRDSETGKMCFYRSTF